MRKQATSTIRRSGGAAGTVTFLAVAAVASAGVIDVSPAGSPYPEAPAGPYVDGPFQSFVAGTCFADPSSNDVVHAAAGFYDNEIGAMNQPTRVEAVGGLVTVGRIRPNTTTLRVLTYNVHLFGNALVGFEIPGTVFADAERAALIGAAVSDEDADVVLLQEVWDDDLGDILINNADFPYVYFDTETDEFDDLVGSGLMVLSRYPLSASDLVFFDDEDNVNVECYTCVAQGCFPPLPACAVCFQPEIGPCESVTTDPDSFSSKGFKQVAINKDGFLLGMFTAHTQSGGSEDSVEARAAQIAQLGTSIADWRANNPTGEVIFGGDLNVNACSTGSGYHSVHLPALHTNDAYRNAPCTVKDELNDPTGHTFASNNELVQAFGFAGGTRIDHILYSRDNGGGYHVLPVSAEIRRYQAANPLQEGEQSASDLSDHYGLLVEFRLWRD